MIFTPVKFAEIWNAAASIDEVIQITGQTRAGAHSKAWKLRRMGLNVKKFPAKKKEKPIEVRFWEKVQKTDGCWIWTGHRLAKGYGIIARHRRGVSPVQVHRLSYEMHKGAIPEGMIIMHTCDNPPCVNPDHLIIGTYQDNTDDMIRKGRACWQQSLVRGFEEALA